MTRRKRSPPPNSPRKRAAFEIPDSLTQLSVLSRSLAQRADITRGVDKETENSGIVAQAQALSNSPPETEALSKPIRWRHDQRDFPDAQTWTQPHPSSGSRAYAKALEHQRKGPPALELSRGDHFASLQGRQSLPDMPIPSQPYALGANPSLQEEAENTALSGTHESDQSPGPEGSSVAGQKRKRVEFVARHQREFLDSQPWPQTIVRGALKSFDRDTEHRRQAIIAQLMQTGPVSVSSAGTNIQVPTNPEATRPAEPASEAVVDSTEALDLTKDSGQIAALIAKKRTENAATGQLNRLQYLQTEHRQKQSSRQSWPGSMRPLTHPPMPVQPASHLPAWPTSPSPAPVQASMATSHRFNQTGYAEASAATPVGGNDATELDLRSLFSSPGHSPNPGDRNEEDEAERVLRHAFNYASNNVSVSNPGWSAIAAVPSQPDDREAASPSDQLLSNLAHVSSDALAQLNTQHRTPNRSRAKMMPTRSPFPASRLVQLPSQKVHMPAIQTSHAQAKAAAILTPEQQEFMLIQRHSERSQWEGKKIELRKIAEERAKQVQEENHKRQRQSQQERSEHQDQGQWGAQPPISAPSIANPSSWKAPPNLWSSTGITKNGMRSSDYAQSQGMPPVFSTSGGGNGLQNPLSAGYGSFTSSGSSTAARFRNASQSGFEVPKR